MRPPGRYAMDAMCDDMPLVFVVDDDPDVSEANARGLRERYATLTSREREVMAGVTAGLLNKQVGAQLGISEITVKAHRGRMMRKMQVRSLAVLVEMTSHLDRNAQTAFT